MPDLIHSYFPHLFLPEWTGYPLSLYAKVDGNMSRLVNHLERGKTFLEPDVYLDYTYFEKFQYN